MRTHRIRRPDGTDLTRNNKTLEWRDRSFAERYLTAKQRHGKEDTTGWTIITVGDPAAGEDNFTTTVDGAAAHAATRHRDPVTGLYY